jgi:hypothetical protein
MPDPRPGIGGRAMMTDPSNYRIAALAFSLEMRVLKGNLFI